MAAAGYLAGWDLPPVPDRSRLSFVLAGDMARFCDTLRDSAERNG